MAACGVNETGQREILAVEPMLEESEEAYLQFFRSLKDRGLRPPKLVISDANTGLISAIRKGFVGASGARCKVHFMRNILVHVSHKKRERFAAELKSIWLAAGKTEARQRADILIGKYKKTFPKAVKCLEEGLEDSLTFYDFPQAGQPKGFLDKRSSTFVEEILQPLEMLFRIFSINTLALEGAFSFHAQSC